MGLIQAVAGMVSGSLADQWKEVIEPGDMGEGVVFVKGQKLQNSGWRSSNRRGTDDLITDGSVIHVYERQAMLMTDGGKITDFSAEPGVYQVSVAGTPSYFGAGLDAAVEDTFKRFQFGGGTPQKQQVFYVNLQEIKGIKFGTPNPVNYFDAFYNAELFLRCFGTYSIRIVDPIKFYAEVIARDATYVHIDQIKDQYQMEFLEALSVAINQMSVDGIRISQVASKASELSRYMSEVLDPQWLLNRGIEVVSVGIASLSYDEESKALINMRNKGAMLSDPAIRESFVQGSVASGLQAAGSNPGGAGAAFMGMGMGMNASGGFMAAASVSNQGQMAKDQAGLPAQNTGESGGFCPNCGLAQPVPRPNFCASCGNKLG